MPDIKTQNQILLLWQHPMARHKLISFGKEPCGLAPIYSHSTENIMFRVNVLLKQLFNNSFNLFSPLWTYQTREKKSLHNSGIQE